MPEQITNKLKENPGAEFIVVQRVRQGEEPQVWASGDPTQTRPFPARLHVAGVQGAGDDLRATGGLSRPLPSWWGLLHLSGRPASSRAG
jgi:hypothetical protein